MIRLCIYFSILICLTACGTTSIDRYALVSRNNPVVTEFDRLSSLSVGNGEFAYTVDATGLQTFPEMYSKGVPLGTQSQWGWHSFPNPEQFLFEETLRPYNYHGHESLYSVHINEPVRNRDAVSWYRANPHRLHLGIIGMELTDNLGDKIAAEELKNLRQELKLWDGLIQSYFEINGLAVEVQTICHPQKDAMAVKIKSELISKGNLKLNFRFAYPTGNHSDDACDWNSADKHITTIIEQTEQGLTFERQLDCTTYYVTVNWTGKAVIEEKEKHYFVLSPESDDFSMVCYFSEK